MEIIIKFSIAIFYVEGKNKFVVHFLLLPITGWISCLYFFSWLAKTKTMETKCVICFTWYVFYYIRLPGTIVFGGVPEDCMALKWWHLKECPQWCWLHLIWKITCHGPRMAAYNSQNCNACLLINLGNCISLKISLIVHVTILLKHIFIAHQKESFILIIYKHIYIYIYIYKQ